MTTQEQTAEIARLTAENAALKAAKVQALSIKVSEKGAVSVYGLMRFPVTLYPEAFLRLLDAGDRIKAFIAANRAELDKRGAESKAAKQAAKVAGPSAPAASGF